MTTNRILIGNAATELASLPSSCIDTIITSPPYFRLRNYQHTGQLGLEPTVDHWVDELALVARGLHRVLRPHGSFWLNLGDTYARNQRDGAQPRSLLLGPERLALRLIADGWILRNKVIWAKTNPMPSSVRSRLRCSYEVVYFFTKSQSAYFDLDAIREPLRSRPVAKTKIQRTDRSSWSVPAGWRGPNSGTNGGLAQLRRGGRVGHPAGKNPGDVWTLPTAGYRGAHHAVFPRRLVERPLLATCPPRCCIVCQQPWRNHESGNAASDLVPVCGHRAPWRPGVVLDPFMGSGTTAIVAEQHERRWLGIEINQHFADLARMRIEESRGG